MPGTFRRLLKMKIKHLYKEDIKLTYYIFGNHARNIVLINAPGYSIKIWLPIINILQNEYCITCLDYRGFPEREAELHDSQCTLKHYVDDVNIILEKENIKKPNFISWCSGSKVVLDYYRQYPGTVQSFIAIGIDFDTTNKGVFPKVMSSFMDRLESNPNLINSIINLMKNISGLPASDNDIEDEMIKNKNFFSDISFLLIDSPIGLKNYFKIEKSLKDIDLTHILSGISIPVIVLYGAKDVITPIEPIHLELYKGNKNIECQIIDNATHYMSYESPGKMAKIIDEKIKNNG